MPAVLAWMRPVRWMLQSRSLSGRLRVLFAGPAGSRVEDLQVAETQSLEAKRLRLADASFEGLWRSAAAETGVTPVSYAKAKKANILSLVVAKRSVRLENSVNLGSGDAIAKLYEEPPGRSGDNFSLLDDSKSSSSAPSTSDLAEKTVLIPGSVLEEALSKEEEAKKEELVRMAVRRATRKKCSQSDTVVSIRKTGALQKLAVQEITLADRTCVAETNRTHWVLRSPR